MSGRIYVATETFSSAYVAEVIHKGVTRVREGHVLLEMHPDSFELLGEEQRVQFESTREPSAPVQVREELEHTELVSTQLEPKPPYAPEVAPLEDMKRADLEKMALQLGVDAPGAFPNKGALIAAINSAQ